MDQLILPIVKDFLKNQTLLIFWFLPLPSVTKLIETPIFSRKSPKKMPEVVARNHQANLQPTLSK